jgi:hypothetical protein
MYPVSIPKRFALSLRAGSSRRERGNYEQLKKKRWSSVRQPITCHLKENDYEKEK